MHQYIRFYIYCLRYIYCDLDYSQLIFQNSANQRQKSIVNKIPNAIKLWSYIVRPLQNRSLAFFLAQEFHSFIEMDIMDRVGAKHASEDAKYYCLYMYYFCGLSKAKLANYFQKAESTIGAWIKKYEDGGGVSRADKEKVYRRYGEEKREWLVELYKTKPVLYLDEAKYYFDRQFGTAISKSCISTILHDSGMTWKVLERRAIQICEAEIVRFALELNSLPWILNNLVFLDEVSFDNRDMLRKKGFGFRGIHINNLKGKKLYYRGEFCRKPRLSLLCFIGIDGLLDTFSTEGTFDRLKFIACCKEFALKNPHVKQYPGPNSVWILDGAAIHCDPNIVYYLRSLGIYYYFIQE